MISVASQGDQACVVSTEHSLVTDTKGGVYALVVDLSPMVGGDTIEIRLKSKLRDTGTGNTARTIKYATYSGSQTDPTNKDLGPITCDLHCEATIKQTAGTSRTIPWKLIRVA